MQACAAPVDSTTPTWASTPVAVRVPVATISSGLPSTKDAKEMG